MNDKPSDEKEDTTLYEQQLLIGDMTRNDIDVMISDIMEMKSPKILIDERIEIYIEKNIRDVGGYSIVINDTADPLTPEGRKFALHVATVSEVSKMFKSFDKIDSYYLDLLLRTGILMGQLFSSKKRCEVVKS